MIPESLLGKPPRCPPGSRPLLPAASPSLLRVDYDAGHGLGSTKTQRDVELADAYSFLLWQFGIPEFEPAGTAAKGGCK
jgi:hypothetical protein